MSPIIRHGGMIVTHNGSILNYTAAASLLSVYNLDVQSGWLVPTEAEWQAEIATWATNDYNGAFGSPLKLSVGGLRSRWTGSLDDAGSYGNYWSSSVSDSYPRYLLFYIWEASTDSDNRAEGRSVRLIKETGTSLVEGDQTFTYNGASWTYQEVESSGRIWMDRNLGASRVATAFDDALAYGDLFQWGRNIDGHQVRTSSTTAVLSSTDDPGHGNFITSPSDWRNPQNDDLWQPI